MIQRVAVFVGHRLMAAGDIDDAQTAVTEGRPGIVIEPGRVRAAVPDGVRHPLQDLFRSGTGRRGGETGNPAHKIECSLLVVWNCGADPLVRSRPPGRLLGGWRGLKTCQRAGPGGPAQTRGSAPPMCLIVSAMCLIVNLGLKTGSSMCLIGKFTPLRMCLIVNRSGAGAGHPSQLTETTLLIDLRSNTWAPPTCFQQLSFLGLPTYDQTHGIYDQTHGFYDQTHGWRLLAVLRTTCFQ